jgi:cell division protein FtsL
MRSLCLLAFGCLVGLFAYTYDLKIKTRALETDARELITALQDESDFLALMRAEVSYLSRPERIEEMAKKTLKLEPISSQQLVPWSAVVTGTGASVQPSSSFATPIRRDGIAALIEKSSIQSAVTVTGER